MTYEQVIKLFGSQAKAARKLGIKPPSVFAWKKSGIPLPRQYQIQVLTDGILVADSPERKAA